MEARWEFQSACHDCFTRSEPRAQCFDSMVGQWSQRERKAVEPMALHVEGGTLRGLQRFLSEVRWEEAQRLWHYHQLVAEARGEPEGVRMVAAAGCEKKGTDAVGVVRQDWGPLGQVEHGQGGVCAAYASRQG